ncbi:MAG TPA: hypothetical protein VLV89_03940, partial [Candidatus Acidoferrum sp.]|nr:hypothetical protein [Candidatus Acidoferrum sp.]
MNRKIVGTIALPVLILAFVISAAWAKQAQPAPAKYPSMFPVEQYLIADRSAEIALARTAAPEAISGDANILVLGRHGYESAVTGKNGFTCLVERGWNSPFDSPDFWNPKLRGPDCYNPPAVRCIPPLILRRAEWALAGASKDQMAARLKAMTEKKELPALEPGAMTYMMSKQAYLTDDDGHNMSHLMFYLPKGTDWAADLHGSPVQHGNVDVLGTPQPV